MRFRNILKKVGINNFVFLSIGIILLVVYFLGERSQNKNKNEVNYSQRITVKKSITQYNKSNSSQDSLSEVKDSTIYFYYQDKLVKKVHPNLTYLYYYNDIGNLTKEKKCYKHNCNRFILTEYIYDKNNNLIREEKSSWDDSVKYIMVTKSYDIENRLIEEVFAKNRDLDGNEYIYKDIYTYKDTLIEKKIRYKNDKRFAESNYFYNEIGKLEKKIDIKEKRKIRHGKLIISTDECVETYKYNQDGYKIEQQRIETYKLNGVNSFSGFFKLIYKLDDEGRIVEVKRYNPEDNLTTRTAYEYVLNSRDQSSGLK